MNDVDPIADGSAAILNRPGEAIRRIRRLFHHDELVLVRCRMSDVVEELRPVFDMMARWTCVHIRVDIPAVLPEVYETLTFANPAEFLTAFNGEAHGCLVLDIRMPGMSGLELQQHLNRKGSMLPPIFITGHCDVPMAVQAINEGAFEFIQKPFRDQDLLDCIKHALRQDAENREAVARRAEVLRRLDCLTSRERQVMDLVVEGVAHLVKLQLSLGDSH